MKAIHYILLLLLFSSCSSAQYFKVIEATHTLTMGGLQGARSERFNIMIKDNPQLDIKYLLAGNVEITLNKENKNGITYLQGVYFPESQEYPTMNEKSGTTDSIPEKTFDLNTIYLVSENIRTKKTIKQKIKILNKNIKNQIKKEEHPQ
ncbi:hypothetical protein BOQ62_17340 [Chryseobacterium sp. CH21]|uniref:hypothetical protein n=1 Tax=Chryseobacterium sp. CH21 TaxID=713556 RepID=UPI00100BB79B|nr:hypothetical protein [Chryseobacterium sp. CH21]RXM38339.1 hypothetical protein BOQ62_17340 [Chryseobacterium sp. CH21]